MRALSALPPAGAEGGDDGGYGDADGDVADDDDVVGSEATVDAASSAVARARALMSVGGCRSESA